MKCKVGLAKKSKLVTQEKNFKNCYKMKRKRQQIKIIREKVLGLKNRLIKNT